LKRFSILLGAAGFLALSACDKDDPILTGEREDIRAPVTDGQAAPESATQTADAPAPIRLPATRANAEWTQRIGSPATRTDHPALSKAPQLAWSASIGAGDGRRTRITADPVVAEGRVFAMDSQSRVTALSTSGETLWTRDLVPENERPTDASGGGLTYGDDKLFVTTGFGFLTALDPETGAELWQQKLRATGSGTAAVRGGLIYLVAGDDVAWALETDTGRIRWRLSATPDINNVIGGPAPAISDKYAIFAFGSGEVQAAFRKGGLRIWDAQIAGQRPGLASARVADVTGDPVIDGDRIYIGGHSGRMVALRLANGERLWTASEGPLSPVWPAGDSIFLISDRNELVRLKKADGTRVWGTRLPFFVKDRPRKQSEIFAHYGPLVAGGQVVVASSDGKLRFFDPVSGQLARSIEVPGGATSNPVVAGGTLYAVSTKGQLHAFR